jgi:hypothetical protein
MPVLRIPNARTSIPGSPNQRFDAHLAMASPNGAILSGITACLGAQFAAVLG